MRARISLLGAAVTLLAIGCGHSTRDDVAPKSAATASATTGTSLEVLRKPQRSNPQVRATSTSMRRSGTVTAVARARLLGFAPSGSAYVLLAVEGYQDIEVLTRTRQRPHDAICLIRRGSQGGAGDCATVEEVRSGRLFGALAGEVYGVVPDGVAAVAPDDGRTPVSVRHNFFAYPVPVHTPINAPVWLDAAGREVVKR